MTSMAKTERAALCHSALRVGDNEPTLCSGWTVRDLVVHLLIREGNLAAVGIAVPRLGAVTAFASERLSRQPFPELVERLRNGPPFYSPLGWGRLDALANTTEFFVHHEDIRRAQPTWEPRRLSEREEHVLWESLPRVGRTAARRAKVGVVAERSDTGECATVREGSDVVVVRGLPGEIVLYLFGRRAQARVELDGAERDVEALVAADLSL